MIRSKFTGVLFGVLLATFLVTVQIYAQDAAGGAAAGGEEAAAENPQTLWDLIKAGGWAMWPLGAMSVALITLAVYNSMQLTGKKFVPPMLKQATLANMAEVRVRSAIEDAAASPSYLGRLLATALPHVDATDPEKLGRDSVDDSMADFALKENPSYMSWIGYFSVIAQAAPMVGLLGTVSGMIKAFQTLGLSGGANPTKLAANISEALVTTAAGLCVAIPCLFCFYFFKNKFNRLVSEAQETLTHSMDAAVATVNADQQLAKVPEGISEG
ncbi:MAG: MotA/TolQ/ExbB proton channel family protein [Akkermansiaceae bacterium]|nr:MotA/TolQ/ExbB proton channel family protein [Akkermansiaceae bacterium]MCP5549469.1 MotA/TolQ/ExbB proton channel family protein [Akkermansiaceae bacterium]